MYMHKYPYMDIWVFRGFRILFLPSLFNFFQVALCAEGFCHVV